MRKLHVFLEKKILFLHFSKNISVPFHHNEQHVFQFDWSDGNNKTSAHAINLISYSCFFAEPAVKLYLQQQIKTWSGKWEVYGFYTDNLWKHHLEAKLMENKKITTTKEIVFCSHFFWPYDSSSLTTMFHSFLRHEKLNFMRHFSPKWWKQIIEEQQSYQTFTASKAYKKILKNKERGHNRAKAKYLEALATAWAKQEILLHLFRDFQNRNFNLDIFGHYYYLSQGKGDILYQKLVDNPFLLFHRTSFLYKISFAEMFVVFLEYTKLTNRQQKIFISYAFTSFIREHSNNTGNTYHDIAWIWKTFLKSDKFQVLYQQVKIKLEPKTNATALIDFSSPQTFAAVLEYAEHKHLLYIDHDHNWLADYILYRAERNISVFSRKKVATTSEWNFKLSEKKIKLISFNDQQIEAFANAFNYQISMITGLPGTGKTAIISQIVNFVYTTAFHHFQKIYVLSLTGVSVRNLKAKINQVRYHLSDHKDIDITTIHSFLWKQGLKKNRSDWRVHHLFLIDETSMVDILLMDDLLRYVQPSDHIVLIGDINQLQPIGPGAFFYDLNYHLSVPAVHLSQVYRQNQNSGIFKLLQYTAKTATIHDFDQQEFETYSDLSLVICATWNQKSVCEEIITIVRQLQRNGNFNAVTDLQILTPFNNQKFGMNPLNQYLRPVLNSQFHIRANSYAERVNTFFRGDKVMVTENLPAIAIYNGDIGQVQKVNFSKQQCFVKFSFSQKPTPIPFRFLTLAYALTIHKAQGSQYKYVIVVANEGDWFWKKSLFYTATSRAMQHLYLITNPRTLVECFKIGRDDGVNRKTLLKKWNPTAKV